jgi:hypothetical protein
MSCHSKNLLTFKYLFVTFEFRLIHKTQLEIIDIEIKLLNQILIMNVEYTVPTCII